MAGLFWTGGREGEGREQGGGGGREGEEGGSGLCDAHFAKLVLGFCILGEHVQFWFFSLSLHHLQ